MDELCLRLPSGLSLRVGTGAPGPQKGDDRFEGERFFSGRLYEALASGRLVVTRRDHGEAFGVGDLDALPLPDFHALRDAAFRVGAIAEDLEPLRCRNCDAELLPDPKHAPVTDLDDWYMGAEPVDLSPISLSDAGPQVTFRVTTAAEARPFFRAALRRPFVVDAAVAKAMGVVEVDGARTPRSVARALDALDPDAWAAFEAAYEYVAYSPKSYFPVVCPSCGTLHDMPAPAHRAIDSRPLPLDAPPFPDEDAFADLALSIGETVYREMGVRNIELEVVMDEAAVDGSGEPLLGSYQPLGHAVAAGDTEVAFLICIYYRTFLRMYEDGPFDVAEELRETIAHEVQHHLHHLEGHDPMDVAERQAAMEELERTYGERAVRRARVAGAVAEARNMGWLVAVSAIVLGVVVLFLYLTGRL